MSGRRASVRTVAPVVAAVAALALLAGCGGKSANQITVGPVTRGTVTEVVEAPATVEALRTASVDAPASGTVSRLFVTDGQHVDRGQLLLRISSPSAQSALAAAERADAQAGSAAVSTPSAAGLSSSVQRSDAAASRAFAQAEAAVEALPDGPAKTAAEAQLATARAQYAAARSAVTQAVAQLDAGVGSVSSAVSALTQAQQVQTRAALTLAQQTVAALDVRAPIAGLVSLGTGGSSSSASSSSLSSLLAQVPAGQQGAASSLLGGSGSGTVTGVLARGVPVSSGQSLVTITDVSTLSLTAQVDETDVLLVKPGVRADAELSAVPGAEYASVVTAVGLKPTTSSAGGVTYDVRLSLGPGVQADGEVAPTPRPGMSAVAQLRVLTAHNAVSVPAAAVFQDGALSSVWVVENGVAHSRHVRVGAQGEATYQILEGVSVGDTVVLSGADQVREGQHVG